MPGDDLQREMLMQAVPEQLQCPDVSVPQRATAELVKRIRKLRWIGLEAEADQLQFALSGALSEAYMFVDPQDTD